MISHFSLLSGSYIEAAHRLATIDGRSVENPIGGPRITFGFAVLEKKICELAAAADAETLT